MGTKLSLGWLNFVLELKHLSFCSPAQRLMVMPLFNEYPSTSHVTRIGRGNCGYNCEETKVQSLGQGDPREKKIATYSSILAWKILWIEEPGRL